MRVHALFLLFLLSSIPALRAQSTNASISGLVTDPSQALIAVAVAAINTATNFRYEATTNSSGECYLTNLPPAAIKSKSKNPASKN